jgi:hypothetical protein
MRNNIEQSLAAASIHNTGEITTTSRVGQGNMANKPQLFAETPKPRPTAAKPLALPCVHQTAEMIRWRAET